MQRRHHAFQRLLRTLAVVNPYAPQLAYGDTRLQARRDQPKFLNLIKAVAFLRQLQKPVLRESGGDYIEVDLTDIALANGLAAEILVRSLDELSVPARTLLGELQKLVAERLKAPREGAAGAAPVVFSRREVRRFTGWSNYRVHTHIKELVNLEYVLVKSGSQGAAYGYRLAPDVRDEMEPLSLKSAEELQAVAPALSGASL